MILVGSCTNTDKGAKDTGGDGCDEYAKNKHWCGKYDDKDFKSKAMCCACGGGATGNLWQRLINLFVNIYATRFSVNFIPQY